MDRACLPLCTCLCCTKSGQAPSISFLSVCVGICVCVCVSVLPCTCVFVVCLLSPGPRGSRGTAEAGAAVACQPGAPAAPLSFTAPHMVLQCWVPRGLLAPHHPGPGPATRSPLPPVSPLHQGPPSPLSPLYPRSLWGAAPPLLFIVCILSQNEPRSFLLALASSLNHAHPLIAFLSCLTDVSFFPLSSSVSYFCEGNVGSYGSH